MPSDTSSRSTLDAETLNLTTSLLRYRVREQKIVLLNRFATDHISGNYAFDRKEVSRKYSWDQVFEPVKGHSELSQVAVECIHEKHPQLLIDASRLGASSAVATILKTHIVDINSEYPDPLRQNSALPLSLDVPLFNQLPLAEKLHLFKYY